MKKVVQNPVWLYAIAISASLLVACGGQNAGNKEKAAADSIARLDSIAKLDSLGSNQDTLGGNECLTIAGHCEASCSTAIVNYHQITQSTFNSMVGSNTGTTFTKTYVLGLLTNLTCEDNDYVDITEAQRSLTVGLSPVQWNNPSTFPTNMSMFSPMFLTYVFNAYPTADNIEVFKAVTLPGNVPTAAFKVKAGSTTLFYGNNTESYP